MKVVFIYRSPKMGFSIDNVFRPIEKKMNEKCEVDSITFSKQNYSLSAIIENIMKVRKYMKKNPNAIIHITGTENYLLPFLRKYKTVVTVHDLGFYTAHKKTLRLYLKFPLWISSLRLADKVTFISEKSLKEAQELVKFKKGQTCVVMNPVSDVFVPNLDYCFNEQNPTILSIGTGKNKNLERTILAIKDIQCHLRIVGALNAEQKNLLKENSINFSQVENISNEQIIKEYQNCDIVCFPSIHEGFGMPIIEGQAIGKAVVTSDVSPMKEIANGSCSLVNPLDVKSIHDGIINAISNHRKYEQLGKENVKRFSVDIKTQEYFNIYQTL